MEHEIFGANLNIEATVNHNRPGEQREQHENVNCGRVFFATKTLKH